MRDLGEAGETAFISFCAIAGITANKSIKDRHGWDIFIEFEGDIDIGDAARMHEPLMECKVQIKTTDARKRALPVTLSNLKAMATSTLPAFYVLLEFDGSDSPKRVFIRHIDEPLVSEILQRVRIATTKPTKPNLHKKTMLIKFNDDTEVNPLNANSIRDRIKKFIGPSPSNYIKSKQQYMEKVGYEKGAFSINFSINGEENLKDFINMHLGIGGSAEIHNISSFTTRFGVSSKTPELQSDSAVLKVMAVTADGSGHVQFRNRNNGSTVRYAVNLYRAGLASWIPKQHQKLRLSTDQIDIQISLHNNNILINYNFQNNKPKEIQEHIKALKLLIILSTPSNVDMTFTFNEKQLSGKLKGTPEPSDFDPTSIIKTLELLMEIMNHFEHTDPLKLSLNDAYENRRTVTNFKKIISPKESKISFTFSLDSNTPPTKEVACLLVISLKIGDIYLIELIAVEGLLSDSKLNKHNLTAQETYSLYKTTSPTSEIIKSKLIKDIRGACESYISERPIIDLTGAFFKTLDQPNN
ncbi:hypothetical protein A7318_19945 [Pseudomonas lurida]|uniref:hypothetical protein n=1 Tax=Pseudomonas lurida TaxID=244566 RepID=UPI00083E4DCD|nr:hypothetical protein [Pseudomonas lurida]AOE80765.1 hypothetical protein A7318_19945 [Pseudomonas lurida]